MLEISILVDNCGGQNKNNVVIRFLNMVKEGGLFGESTLNFYIKCPIKMTVTAHLTDLRCCTRRKRSLLLRSAVKF